MQGHQKQMAETIKWLIISSLLSSISLLPFIPLLTSSPRFHVSSPLSLPSSPLLNQEEDIQMAMKMQDELMAKKLEEAERKR